jgi:hypothetical protein
LWQGPFTEAWHQLPQQEQQRLLSLVMEALNTAGGKELVLCSAAWSNERWPFFGVEEFPDLEAVQRHEQILTDLNWARYIESRTTLGTELILPQSAHNSPLAGEIGVKASSSHLAKVRFKTWYLIGNEMVVLYGA